MFPRSSLQLQVVSSKDLGFGQQQFAVHVLNNCIIMVCMDAEVHVRPSMMAEGPGIA